MKKLIIIALLALSAASCAHDLGGGGHGGGGHGGGGHGTYNTH